MNKATQQRLGDLIRNRAKDGSMNYDDAELLRVLARLVERATDLTPLHGAFGAPGDWGYGTQIGDTLRDLYAGK